LGDPNPLANADVAFIGTVALVDDTAGPLGSGMDPILNTFFVEEVRKGDLGEFVVIRSGRGGGDCGIPMKVGERWLIYASRFGDDELSVGICGPTGSSALMASGLTPPPAPHPQALSLVLIGALVALGMVGLAAIALRRRRGTSAPNVV
jgi:hypothetical protein